MDVLLDALFGLVANAWPPLRRAGRRWFDPHAWADADRSLWSWLAALGLLLPLLPIGVGTAHFAGLAFRIMGDDLMFVLGILLFLPLVAFALMAACMLASWALTVAFWLLTGRPHAGVFAAGYLFVVAVIAWPLFSADLDRYGWAVLGTTASATLLLLARAAAGRGSSRLGATAAG